MPTVLRVGRYRFHFFSNEGQEASQIHVKAGSDGAKFWLEPVELAADYGFKGHEPNEIKKIIEENQTLLIEAWYEYFGQN
jgi:hypothetical protein